MAGAVPTPADAQATSSRDRDVLVVSRGTASEELQTRLRGQTSDLPVALHEAEPGAEWAQQSALERLAARHGVEIVLGFDTTGLDGDAPSLVVVVALPEEGRTLLRRLRSGGEPLGRSALLEEASLLAREALLALLAGGTVGVVAPLATSRDGTPRLTAPEREAARDGASSGAANPSRTTSADAITPSPNAGTGSGAGPARDVSTTPRAPGVGLGPFVGFDGLSFHGGLSVHVRLALGDASFFAEGALRAGLPSDDADGLTDLTLTRHDLDVGIGWRGSTDVGEPSATIVLGGRATHRSVTALDVNVTADDPRWRVFPFAGARVGWGHSLGAFRVEAEVAADVFPWVPRYRYRDEGVGATPPARSPWVIQPRLGLVVRWTPGGPDGGAR